MNSEKSDAEYVGEYRPQTMYRADWRKDAGSYLSVVFEEDSDVPIGVDIHTEPNSRNRVKVRLSWVKKSNEIKEIEIKKFKHYKNDGWQVVTDDWGYSGVSIKPVTLGMILGFLQTITELDINEIKQRRTRALSAQSGSYPAAAK